MAMQISKKRKFVTDGIFKAELNEFVTQELAEDGYSGVEGQVIPARTEIIILATRTQMFLWILEPTAVVQKRCGFPEGGLCAIAKAASLRQKAKSMKCADGLMIHSGDPVNCYVDTAMCHVLLRQGVLGIKVKTMLPWDPTGKTGPKKPLSDHVSIMEPKDEILLTTPISEQKDGKPELPAMPQPVLTRNRVSLAAVFWSLDVAL
uniref:Ribosomal protein S3 C-terminal domain-containing protein n=1 Tax=Cebus imitator TaxID=2715852 RepID=A0A2K5Q4H6_CEBIM